MGRLTRYGSLPDQPYDPRVTDLTQVLRPPKPKNLDGTLDAYRNRTITNTTPIQLVAGVAVRVLPANPRRTGLLIQNKDTTSALFLGFGNSADANGLSVPAGGFVLFDFTTPAGEVYAFSNANIQAVFIDMSRGY